jgi:hypothetical protein
MLADQIKRIKASFREFENIPNVQFKNKNGGGVYSDEDNFVVVHHLDNNPSHFIKIHEKKGQDPHSYNINKKEALQNHLHHSIFPQKAPHTEFVEDEKGFIYVSEHLGEFEKKISKKDIIASIPSFQKPKDIDRDTEIRRFFSNVLVFDNSDIKPDNSLALKYPDKEKLKVYDIDVMNTKLDFHPTAEELEKSNWHDISLRAGYFNQYVKNLKLLHDKEEVLKALQKVSSEYPQRVQENIESLKNDPKFKDTYEKNKVYVDKYLDNVSEKMNILGKKVQEATKEYERKNNVKIPSYAEQTEEKYKNKQAAALPKFSSLKRENPLKRK